MKEITKEEYLNAIREGASDAAQRLLGVGKYEHLWYCEQQWDFRKGLLSAIERGTKAALKKGNGG